MTIEAAQYISDLNTSYPRSTDLLREGDDHIRMIKNTLGRTFPNIKGPVNISHTVLNDLNQYSQWGPSGAHFLKDVIVDGNTTVSGNFLASSITSNGELFAQAIELKSGSPFIDFHYGNSAADYTTRIIATSAADTLQVISSNGNVYLDVIGRLNVRSNATVAGALHSDGNLSSNSTITGGNLETSGRVTSSGGVYTSRVRCNANGDPSQQGVSIGWNEPPGSGRGRIVVNPGSGTGGLTFDMVNGSNTAVTGSATISGSGDFDVTGRLHANGEVQGSAGRFGGVYIGGASIASDGNINGGKWGGWLDAFLQSDSSNLIRGAGGRLKGFDGVLDGGEVGSNRHTAQIRLDNQAFGMPIHASDRRLKQDIKPIDAAPSLDKINAIEMVEFNWKEKKYTLEDGTEGVSPLAHVPVGFIAQQMQEHIPDAIYSCEEDSPLQVNLLPLVSHLIGAVQTLTKKVEELEAKLEE